MIHHLEAGVGPPMVLLHGGTGGGANWFRIISLLAAVFRLYAPDLPGFGLSAPVTPVPPIGVMAADLMARWLDDNRLERVHVAGTSFGGLTALRLAQRHPGRVATLFLLDAAGLGRAVHPAVRIAALPLLARTVLQPTRAGNSALLRLLLTSDRSRLTAEQLDALTDYLHATAVRAGTDYASATLRLFVGGGGQREVLSADELRSITQPVTVMWGARDRLLPVAHARHAAQHIPHARLLVLPHAGHSPNWEAPEEVAASLRAHAT
jgi:pimeloyl-ACP methyl ester carboxylesterase